MAHAVFRRATQTSRSRHFLTELRCLGLAALPFAVLLVGCNDPTSIDSRDSAEAENVGEAKQALTCATLSCQNGGTCVDGANSASCQCAPGWAGATCSLAVPPPLLAYEPFDGPVGPLNAGNSGVGWGTSWDVQGSNNVPGYEVKVANPLTFAGLPQAGGYASGGYAWRTAGRSMDLSATSPFSSYLFDYNYGKLIGKPGQTVWMSVLLRKENTSWDSNFVVLHDQATTWWAQTPKAAVGYFGSASENAGVRYWSLSLRGVVQRTNVPIVLGQAALLVLRLDFNSTSQASLYVNPPLNAAPPSAPDATGTTADSLAFRSLAYYAGYDAGQSTVDEIRFGDTFAAVTHGCVPGYAGANCEINIDECAAAPCQNGGSCTDGINAFTCACAPGYSGSNCETNIDDCAWGPCQNGGTCSDGVNSYTCSCASGYSGANCEVQSCGTLSCQNGGTCVNGTSCQCTADWSGASCDQSARPPLMANEPFEEPVGALYGGNSGAGWAGIWDMAPTARSLPGYQVTASNPLTFAGLPQSGGNLSGGYSWCATGRPLDISVTGPFSAYLFDSLYSKLIGKPGQTLWMSMLFRKETASQEPNYALLSAGSERVWSATPLAAVGYFGSPSENAGVRYWSLAVGGGFNTYQQTPDVVHRTNVPIVQGQAALLVLRLDFNSTSRASLYVNPPLHGPPPAVPNAQTLSTSSLAFRTFIHYAGSGAGQSAIDEIRFGRTFAAAIGGCAPGYAGNNCEINIDECAATPCQNGGTCTDGINAYSCTCAAGYAGTNCQTNINDCAPNPCQNGGTCTDSINAYTCACPAGYSGTNCQTNINDCAPNPCQNGGTCTDGVASYTCSCAAGYSGTNCQTNINDCAPNPCVHGTCTDGVASYSCSCAAGYSGTTCQTNINDCAPNPCVHGTCTDGVASYTCACATGYSGTTCQTNINDCSPNPCQNGGTCTDGVNAYTCACSADYTGTNCQTSITCPGPSCAGLTQSCGPGGNESCCASAGVTGGTYNRSNDASYPATVDNFRLDRFEITVGRFRKFVDAYPGSKPGAGAGAHTAPSIPGSGWNTAWNANLPTSQAGLKTNVNCGGAWTDTAGANEAQPMSCLSWYEAFAFCAWDGGWLPTEAEWNYAAAGGNEQRKYPWSNPPSSTTIDTTYVDYGGWWPGAVGSKSPKGDGKWGQADMAGSVWEWNLDWYSDPYSSSCTNCTNLTSASNRVMRGGSWDDSAAALLSTFRYNYGPTVHNNSIGARCARSFTGTCQTNIDDCATNACQNGSTCVDGVNSYTCSCAAGYSGTYCETNINECSPNPCPIGDTCTDGVNGYTCVPTTVETIAAGYCFSSALKSDGTVWATGRNTCGLVHDGTFVNQTSMGQVNGFSDMVAIANGTYHLVALKSDGTVWALGNNTQGQLGDGTTTNRTTPVQLSGLSNVVAIGAGLYATLALKSDGTIWYTGNLAGSQPLTPMQLPGISGVSSFAMGYTHALFLKQDGTVWGAGTGGSGQLGNGRTDLIAVYTPVKAIGVSSAVAVAAGNSFSLVLKSDGSVWGFGLNASGQLAFSPSAGYSTQVLLMASGVAAISAGHNHSVALKSDGTVWAWGSGVQGQLGGGTNVSYQAPVQMSAISGVVGISAGPYSTLMQKSDGTVWGTGGNSYGALGDGTVINRNVPQLVPMP